MKRGSGNEHLGDGVSDSALRQAKDRFTAAAVAYLHREPDAVQQVANALKALDDARAAEHQAEPQHAPAATAGGSAGASDADGARTWGMRHRLAPSP